MILKGKFSKEMTKNMRFNRFWNRFIYLINLNYIEWKRIENLN